MLHVPVRYAAPWCSARTAQKHRLSSPGLHNHSSGELATEVAGYRVCRIELGAHTMQLQCSSLPAQPLCHAPHNALLLQKGYAGSTLEGSA